jgi:hypothetical protein
MTNKAKQHESRVDRLVLWCLGAAIVLTVVAVALLNPGVLSFRTFNAMEFVQSMLPLVMFALFIERVLEVFLTSWRAHDTAVLKERASQAKSKRSEQKPSESDLETLRRHKSQTQRIAFFAGTTLGVVIAALGGGSDALHQLVLVFTNFFQSAAGRAKGAPVARN